MSILDNKRKTKVTSQKNQEADIRRFQIRKKQCRIQCTMKADASCIQGKMTVTLQNSVNRESAGSPFSPWTSGLLADAANCLPSSIFSSAGGLMENLVSPLSDADHTCTAQQILNLDSNPKMKTFSSTRNLIFFTEKRIQFQYRYTCKHKPKS